MLKFSAMKTLITLLLSLSCVKALVISGCKDNFCYFVPKNCAGNDGNVDKCVAGLWVPRPASGSLEVTYRLFTTIPKDADPFFIVMGFSNDIWMGDDSVMGCIYSGTTQTAIAELSYNLGHSNTKLDDQSMISLVNSKNNDGIFSCEFTINNTGKNPKIFNPDKPYYILLARGNAQGTDNMTLAKQHHGRFDDDEFPFVSSDTVNVLKQSEASGDHGWASRITRVQQGSLAQAHGSLMLIGIWIFMSTGYLFSAFYKRLWDENVQIQGKAAWFQIHRVLMSLAIICLIVGFICAFISGGHLVGDLSITVMNERDLQIHAIMGITAVILVIIQPILAILRCGKDSPHRPFFRFAHILIAALIYGLTHGCIFYAIGSGFSRHRVWIDSYDQIPFNIITSFLVVNAGIILVGRVIIMAMTAKSRSVSPMVVPLEKVVENHEVIHHHHHKISGIRIWAGMLYALTFIAVGTYVGLSAVMINMIINPNPNPST